MRKLDIVAILNIVSTGHFFANILYHYVLEVSYTAHHRHAELMLIMYTDKLTIFVYNL